jgi:hypothetical protein
VIGTVRIAFMSRRNPFVTEARADVLLEELRFVVVVR